MLDIRLIRKNPEVVRRNLERRGKEYSERLGQLLKTDERWRKNEARLNSLRKIRNEKIREVSKLKKEGKPAEKSILELKKISEELELLEKEQKKLEDERRKLLLRIPNLLHPSVPEGKDESENVELRRWGKPPRFDFEPKDHLTLLQNLGLIDTQRAAKVAGRGFLYLKGKLVLLDLALQRFAIDFLTKKGFTLVEPPFMIGRQCYEGMIGDPLDFAEASYKVEKEDLYLIPTAEYTLGAMFANEVFLAEDLPLRLCGVSPCFRTEVGTHGKYTKGLFRMHHFNKVEQFVFCKPEDSWKILEELQKNSEQLFKKLGLHFRVVVLCSGDTGAKSAKTYDLEVWMADGKFREVGSNSNCTDYQARRLNIRYREKEGAPPKNFVHTLNNTAIATSRAMIAIVEQFQQADGSVKIPKVLWRYTGFKKLE